MKNLHIVIDQKFIDGAISLFETDKRINNDYIIISNEYKKNDYVKSDKVRLVKPSDFLSLCNNYDIVTLHSLPSLPFKLLLKIPKRIKVIWLAWGYDLYEHEYNAIISIKIFNQLTKKCLETCKWKCIPNIRKYANNIIFKFELKKILSRINYFSGVFPYEFDEVKKRHKCFNAMPLDFYYGSTNFFIPEIPENTIVRNKKDIFLGNSANPANNHLDALNSLIQLGDKIKDSRLIMPLSYGGSTSYINLVKEFANNNLSCRIISMEEYLPLNDYLNLISNCKVAIFAHERQQASDNIFLQMIYGAKVYMSETSLAYKYLKSQGYIIYSIQNDIQNIMEDISDEVIINNRRLLSEQYSSKQLIYRIKKMNDELL